MLDRAIAAGHPLPRTRRGEHRHAQPVGQTGRTTGVIAMLVSEHYSCDPLERETGAHGTPLDLPRAEAGIDEQCYTLRFNREAVASGS
jgi:hypothetical protein